MGAEDERDSDGHDFREPERATIYHHTGRGALSEGPPHTSRAPEFATQDHVQARDSNATQGNAQAQDMDSEATSANLYD